MVTDLAPGVARAGPADRRGGGAGRTRSFADWAQIVVTVVVLLGCALFVFLALHPSKLLLNTTPAGGDMGAHVWAPWFLKNHLFPHGRISGWAPDWYDGFPALTYYFPGPYLVIALLSYVLPYGVAFKLVSVSGVICLPLAAYAFGRLTGMRFPGPQLLAVATVPFLFDRYFTIWGGNIASTLAGEFAFSISLSLALLFIGVFSYSLRTGRYRWLAALLLAATLSSHLLPTFFAVAGAALVWLLQPGRRRLRRALTVGLAGFALTAWWLVPFAVRLGYSNDMGWERSTAYMKGLFPFLCNTHKTDASINCPAFGVTSAYTAHLEVVVALAAAGVIGGLILRRRSTLLIAGIGLVFAAAFRLMPQGTLWNARMLPFWYLSLYLAAATCVAESALAIGVLLGRVPRRGGVPPGEDGDLEAAPVEEERELVGAGVAGGPAAVGGASGGTIGASGGAIVDWAAGGWGDEAPADPDGWEADWGGWGGDAEGEPELVPSRWPAIVVPLVVLAFVLTFIGQTIPDFQGFFTRLMGHNAIGGSDQRTNLSFVSGWANWNYSGYQQKTAYPEYRDVIDTMARVGKQDGCGRAMWEYEPEEDQFGTPMALMLLPMWTNECIGSEEGLFFESSATVPYHFLNQSELSQNPSRAMRDLPYRNYDIVDGIEHMQLLGVRYYMAVSPAAQTAAHTQTSGAHPLLRLIAQTATHERTYTVNGTSAAQPRHWEIYEIADSAPVAGLSFKPAVMQGIAKPGLIQSLIHDVFPWFKNVPGGRPWINAVVPWYQDASRWPVPLAATGPSDWPRVKGASANPPRIAVPTASVTNIVMKDDRISFDVDRVGSPVLVKTSYFPNWQATGANGPWRVSPNLMVVVPTSTHVSLHYGFTPVDNLGRILSLGGLAGVVLLARAERGGEDVVVPDGGVPGDDHGGAPLGDTSEPLVPVADGPDDDDGEAPSPGAGRPDTVPAGAGPPSPVAPSPADVGPAPARPAVVAADPFAPWRDAGPVAPPGDVAPGAAAAPVVAAGPVVAADPVAPPGDPGPVAAAAPVVAAGAPRSPDGPA